MPTSASRPSWATRSTRVCPEARTTVSSESSESGESREFLRLSGPSGPMGTGVGLSPRFDRSRAAWTVGGVLWVWTLLARTAPQAVPPTSTSMMTTVTTTTALPVRPNLRNLLRGRRRTRGGGGGGGMGGPGGALVTVEACGAGAAAGAVSSGGGGGGWDPVPTGADDGDSVDMGQA